MSDDIFTKIPEMNYTEEAANINTDEFIKVVESRRSVRVYTDEKIPEDVTRKCLDLALMAPNSSNLQPWEFYWIRDEGRKKQIASYCFNQPAARTAQELIVCVARRDTWKKHATQMITELEKTGQKVPSSVYHYYQKLAPFVYTQGPFGVVGFFKKIFLSISGIFQIVPRDCTSIADMRVWMHKSTALACENIMLGYRAFGYDTCPMEGFDSKRVKRLLKLPRAAEVCMIISAGKRADNGVYGPRVRFAKDQFITECDASFFQ